MEIVYYGHSCFKLIESTGTSIVCDPYSDEVGYSLPPIKADAVTVSHRHFDHDAVKKVGGKPVIIENVSKYDLPGVEIDAIKSFHDPHQGKERGTNVIFKFRMDGIDICHLGDLGEDCSSDLIESLLPVNVLLIPVGGKYTIDAEMAKEYVDRLMPDIVIPMHYRTRNCKLDIDKVDEFLDLFDDDNILEIDGNSVCLSRSDLTGETRVLHFGRY